MNTLDSIKALPSIASSHADVRLESLPVFDLIIVTVSERFIGPDSMLRMKRDLEGLVGETVNVIVCGPGCTVRVERGVAKVENGED